MIALDQTTCEADIAATIDVVRRRPERRQELVALLPERGPLYEGRTSAEVTRLRGYLLASFADTGLPRDALPYLLEALESGHEPYEVAGAAIGLRGVDRPAEQVVPYLVRAVRNLSGADATVSFERYDPRWPYAHPTTALTEVLRTIGLLAAEAGTALPELERLADQWGRYPAALAAELQSTCDAIRSAQDACCRHDQLASCCEEVALVDPSRNPEEPAQTALDEVELEDQDGRRVRFAEFFCAKPSIVAFFYTRCDNPFKCSLMVARLAELQSLIHDQGLSGSLRLAAITYDPDFDLPSRLKLYGTERRVTFGEDMRFFRTTSGFAELSRHFQLQVNYGPSTVNRHQIELYLLDARGDVAASRTRFQWEPGEVVAAAGALLLA